MKLSEDHYNLLKIFPTDKSYLLHKQIENATNKTWDYNKLITLCNDLYYVEFLNGSMQTSGLRITNEGLGAKINYEKTTLREKEIADLNFKKLKFDVKISERIYNTYYSTRAMAIIACAVSISLLLLKLAELLGIL